VRHREIVDAKKETYSAGKLLPDDLQLCIAVGAPPGYSLAVRRANGAPRLTLPRFEIQTFMIGALSHSVMWRGNGGAPLPLPGFSP
jgi:hypothetical protein